MIGQFLDAGIDFFVATSFSKSFSLYGERVGALSVVCTDSDEAARVLSQLKIAIRTNYSTPPTHGAQVVAMVLGDAATARAVGRGAGRDARAHQAHARRAGRALAAAGVQRDMSFVTEQQGMFSYSGLTKPQMQRLREDFARLRRRLRTHLRGSAEPPQHPPCLRRDREGALSWSNTKRIPKAQVSAFSVSGDGRRDAS